MLVGLITWADFDYRAKTKAADEQIKWYNKKYGETEMSKKIRIKPKSSQQDYKKVRAIIKTAQDGFRPGVFMMKMDSELNASWAKIMQLRNAGLNSCARATTDNGAVIAGEYTSPTYTIGYFR